MQYPGAAYFLKICLKNSGDISVLLCVFAILPNIYFVFSTVLIWKKSARRALFLLAGVYLLPTVLRTQFWLTGTDLLTICIQIGDLLL